MRIGIIGSGFGFYGLLPAFRSIKKCKIVCICGKKTKRLVNYCESIGLKKIYQDWETMLEKEKLDAIAIAVPPNVQYKIAKFALKKGLNIFAEKPLASNLKEAKELFILAQKNKTITAVDFIFPEIDEWKKIKKIIDKKVYGKLKHISVDWNFLSYDIKNKIKSWKTNVEEGGGALSFYTSHVLYYLEYYAGKISKIKSSFSYSKGSLNGGEVGVDLILKFENGISGQVNFSCDAIGLNTHKLIFIFEKSTVILENNKDVTNSFVLTIYSQKDKKQIFIKKPNVFKKDEDERVFFVKRMATRFINGCLNKKQISPSFRDGVRIQELLDLSRIGEIK